jgi:hypothetical protein
MAHGWHVVILSILSAALLLDDGAPGELTANDGCAGPLQSVVVPHWGGGDTTSGAAAGDATDGASALARAAAPPPPPPVCRVAAMTEKGGAGFGNHLSGLLELAAAARAAGGLPIVLQVSGQQSAVNGSRRPGGGR